MHAGRKPLLWAATADPLLRDGADALADRAPQVAVFDLDGLLVGLSDPGPAYGATAEDVGRLTLADRAWAVADDHGRRVRPDLCPPSVVLAGGEPVDDVTLSVELAGRYGDLRWSRVSAEPVRDATGRLLGVVVLAGDVTDAPEGRAATSRVLRAYRDVTTDDTLGDARFRALAEGVADVVWQVGADGRVLWVSPSVEQVLGLRPADLMGAPARDLIHPDDIARANAARLEAMAEGAGHGPRLLEMRYRTASGEWRWMSALSRPMFDDEGRVIGGVTALRDAQQEIERRSELEYLAAHDNLTGLLTRESALDELSSVLARAGSEGRTVAVLYLDVDRFKVVNDTHGHQVGDRVLVQVARRLTAALRPDDVVARLGGDEFLVVLHAVGDDEYARTRALDLHTALSRAHEPGLPVTTVSIGLATWDGGQDAAALVDAADQALYRAKASGRDTVSW
jgi:diguanylate cyclase (GGDEF)-like protein/PAS domain S-box-containing protein